MNFLAESFLDEFLDDRPSFITHQDAGADVNISDSKESPKDTTTSSSSFVVINDLCSNFIYFIYLFLSSNSFNIFVTIL